MALSQHGFKTRGSNIFLLFVTLFMFSGGTIFLSLDVTDLVRRMQIIMINHPEQVDLNEKLNEADDAVKRLLWTGEILFVFMLILGDSVVVWRTWTICFSRRVWVGLPIATWVGSTLQAVPIYDARLTPVGNTTFNIVNAVFQQAIGIYPTVIIILVKMHKSLWEAAEIAPTLSHSHMSFVPPTVKIDRGGSVAVTSMATGTVVSSIHDSRQADKMISSASGNKTGDLEKNEDSSLN
ncbi:hypothetical protein BDZ94DRAFT_1338230 [Collybia nuda]|uniref:Uncharacterized protein n=1 Tax=Collybia nuda TaxID=64659 RepID=A0A9P5XXW0_9AGAR|nr:hypothetical protein BDZ94DRAFT_1338230 [Collybia nuda]